MPHCELIQQFWFWGQFQSQGVDSGNLIVGQTHWSTHSHCLTKHKNCGVPNWMPLFGHFKRWNHIICSLCSPSSLLRWRLEMGNCWSQHVRTSVKPISSLNERLVYLASVAACRLWSAAWQVWNFSGGCNSCGVVWSRCYRPRSCPDIGFMLDS